MKSSHCTIATLVCLLALLALPVQAAPAKDVSLTSPSYQLGTWLDSLLEGLVELVLGLENPPPSDGPPPVDGGSCIDPDGCRHGS